MIYTYKYNTLIHTCTKYKYDLPYTNPYKSCTYLQNPESPSKIIAKLQITTKLAKTLQIKSALAFWKAIKVLHRGQERLKLYKVLSRVHSSSKVVLPNSASTAPPFASQNTLTSYKLCQSRVIAF